jgi:glycosyltransferase involved in cell wall biosynthesis
MEALHFVPAFSARSQTFIYDLLLALETQPGLTNEVLTLKRKLEDERPFARVAVARELSFWERIDFKIQRRIAPGGNPSEAVRRLRRERRRCDEADLVHAHFGVAGYRLLKACRRIEELAPKLLVSLHGTDTTRDLRIDPEYRETLIRAAGAGSIFAANSVFLKRKAAEAGIPAERIRVVRNQVNGGFLRAARSRPYGGGALKLISVGRLIPWKGHEHLIRALPLVAAELPGVELSLVGEGSEFDRLKALAEELDVGDRVRFLGALPHREIPLLISGHHVYVQPSVKDPRTAQEESCGVALLEALAVGLPAVITDSPGMVEAVSFESSSSVRIVRRGSHFELAAAILETATDEAAFRLDEPGRVAALRKHSADNQVRELLAVYGELAAGRGRC